MDLQPFDLRAFSASILPINGIAMHVAEIGRGDPGRPVVVCLHGFPDIWAGWARVMGALSVRFRCVAPDQRGVNLTERPTDIAAYRPARLLADLDALIDAVSPDRPVVLAGHDWGGVLAAWQAARRPNRIDRLVLVNATHPTVLQNAIRLDPAQRAASAYIEALRSGRFEAQLAAVGFEAAAQARIAPALAAGTMSTEEAALYTAALSSPEAWRAMINWYRAAPFELGEAAESTGWTADVPTRIPVPTLVIWGARDAVFLPILREGLRAHCDELSMRIIDEVGHNPLREAPGAVASAMTEFLD